VIYSLISDDGRKKRTIISYFSKESEKQSFISPEAFKKLISFKSVEILDIRVFLKGDCFEVLWYKDRIMRFPSVNDFFCYFSPEKMIYNYHEFDYSVIISKELKTDVYIDDNFIIAGRQEDKFYQQSIEVKLKVQSNNYIEPEKEQTEQKNYSFHY